ncbi:hypothetical protein GCM10023219_10410 [Stakelama sediminis]|uniref:Uncharacterized protein n=1 Tax=Stakelama sediminis TaxID=463200 RepID=A0A840YW20_9SPHN|nr:hypothetical protein [Stakelama sediminis]MBB5717765.1 hypothetical protein [Stakelama sediminis]
MPQLWAIAAAAVSVFCIVRGISDFRAKRYVWAVFGLVCGITILALPVPTHAVKIDLPRQGQQP